MNNIWDITFSQLSLLVDTVGDLEIVPQKLPPKKSTVTFVVNILFTNWKIYHYLEKRIKEKSISQNYRDKNRFGIGQ